MNKKAHKNIFQYKRSIRSATHAINYFVKKVRDNHLGYQAILQ